MVVTKLIIKIVPFTDSDILGLFETGGLIDSIRPPKKTPFCPNEPFNP
jgi:hypothetical protein